ncbi:Concanavalin A-like lectin/glucanases superfamily protein [Arsukibacterium tuosuense]|uniref:Concanavalin A-like lectin/glucanases superfamily protein n=1 Tax=Arsukibacterium tuosuense TaxID=1323745 RepID=A0A285JDE6_9GAMM|nr:DUF6701 domain-containing protein [Arsukibacterium tuosuense]SNY58310.1 Concanavalin A-like lectin/glucanases superfamily protein [Arsukibacterium tuosuense]
MRWLLGGMLLLLSTQVLAINCEDIWTEAVRENSAAPAAINLPAALNPVFPAELEPIDYYYSGTFSSGPSRVASSANATARLFIDGSLTIESGSRFNSSNPAENFVLVVTGNLVIRDDVRINGFILAGGAVTIGADTVINGAVTAKGAIANSGTVTYRPDAISELQGGVLCETPLLLPIAEYRFDQYNWDGSIDEVADSIGSNNGQAINTATIGEGQICRASDFSGSGYISLNDLSVLGGTASLSFWINTTASGNNVGWQAPAVAGVEQTGGANDIFWGWLDASGRIGLTKGNDFAATKSTVAINNGEYRHVVLTRNASSGAFQIFIDGELDNSGALASQQGAVTTPFNDLGRVLHTNGVGVNFLTATLDEVQVYDRVLNASQVQRLYQQQNEQRDADGTVRLCPAEPLQCLADDFADDLADWVTASSRGTFTPSIVDGRLRMTQAVTNQATSATFQRLYPAADNLVIIEFDYRAYGGSGADGLAVVLSDATVTPQPGAFGGPLGYGFKPGIPGFAGGWLGFGLDEFGNFSNEGGAASIGRRRQSVVVRGSGEGTSGYRYLRGTCDNGTINRTGDCLNPRVDGNADNPHRYRFTVDSRIPDTTIVSVERDHGTGYITLIEPFDARSQFGQAAAPENFFLSLTGSTGGSTNIHELDNINICALRSSPVGQQIDHFEFDHSGQALTCKPETLTVRACANADCSQLVTDPVTATLSPATVASGGWVGGNVINFAGGTTTVDLRRNTAGNTLVGVSGSVPGTRPLSQTLCRSGAGPLTTAACNISFASAGLVFSVPDGIANQPANNIVVSAVRQSDSSQQCVPAFADVSRSVGFWSSYIDPGPTGRPVSLRLQVNGSNIGLTEGSRTPVALNFDENGEAVISVNYADAGQVQLNGRYSGTPANDDSGLILNGSDQFIRRPAGLCIINEGHCLAADSSCPVFKRAAEAFPLTISAHAWQEGSTDICANPVTPNFQQADISLSHSLVAPAGEPGSLGSLSYAHQRAVNSQTSIEQSVSEVGVFRFNTAPVNYLTMADPVPAATGQPSGRFVPADFAVSDISSSAACGSFSYMQQPFALGFTLTARNTLGQRTRNYYGGFANTTLLLQAENADDAVDLTGRLSSSGFGSWTLGQQTFSTTELRLNRQASGAADGPFSELSVALNVIDADGSLVANPDSNVSNIGCAADDSCNAAALMLTDIRYGRMQMANGFGPEFDDLPVNLTAEYWDGSRFLSNSADNCSVISAANLSLSNSLTSAVANVAALSAGKTPADGLLLLAPAETGTVGATYQVPVWLQYDWNDDGSYTNSPVAEFIFGRYRGNPRQIYWHERF